MEQDRFYCLEVVADGLEVFCGLNNAPLFFDDGEKPSRIVRTVNEWILPQANALTAYLQWPPNLKFEPSQASFSVNLFITDPGAKQPKLGTMLAQFNWPDASIPEAYPHQVNLPFDAPVYPGSRLWEAASVLDGLPGPAEHGRILELVERYRSAMLERRDEEVLSIAEWKYGDEALANGYDPSRNRDVVATLLDMVTDQADVVSEALNRDQLSMELCCANRLLRVTRLGTSATFEIRGVEAKGEFDVYLAKIEGMWAIVR